MTEWDSEAVLAVADEWVWIPDGARHERTDDVILIAYPEWFIEPTVARPAGSCRDPAEIVDEAHAIAREWGRDRVSWVVNDLTRSEDLEQELVRRGGRLTERADILALPLGDGVPELGVPDGIEVRRVIDERGLWDAYTVEADAFDGPAPTDDRVAHGMTEVRAGLATGSMARYVAYVDGAPVSAAGWGPVGTVARLWGAGTIRAARRRGGYRAVLEARLRAAVEGGCTLGLTHGRVDTSSPILQRVGFRRHGEQRHLRLDLP